MSARGRRHRVVIEEPTGTPDAAGQLIATWRTFENTYASIMPIGASERIRAGEQIGQLSHRVRIPYIRGVTRSMRIRFEEYSGKPRFLNIHSVINPEERNRELQLLCEEEI